MAQGSFIWDGNSGAGGLGDCGPYSAAKWEEVLKAIMSGKSGIAEVSHLQVTETSPTSKSVRVTTGRAVVRGKVYWLDADTTLAISDNTSGNPRIDRVVLEADWATQTVRLKVLEGTPSASPSAPSLTQVDGTLWQLPLAQVAVANGFTSITSGDITDEREAIYFPLGMDVVTVSGKSANYSTTSTTFVKVSSDLDLSITTHGGNVLVWFAGVTGDSSSGTYWDIWVDGTQVTPGGGFAYTKPQTSQTAFTWLLTGLSAGTHTIELYWHATISSYPAVLHVDTTGQNAAQFGAMEVGA